MPHWTALLVAAVVAVTPFAVKAEQAGAAPQVTFHENIAPILQRSCEGCHRPDGVAPMSLATYETRRPVGAPRSSSARMHRAGRRV